MKADECEGAISGRCEYYIKIRYDRGSAIRCAHPAVQTINNRTDRAPGKSIYKMESCPL